MELLDLRLNAIVDPERAGGRDLVDLACQVGAGGATLVQLRDKKSDTRRMVETARFLRTHRGARESHRRALDAVRERFAIRCGPLPSI